MRSFLRAPFLQNGKAEVLPIPNSTNPFRTAVPFWGQTTQNLSGLSLKRNCSPKSVAVFPETSARLEPSENVMFDSSALLAAVSRQNERGNKIARHLPPREHTALFTVPTHVFFRGLSWLLTTCRK